MGRAASDIPHGLRVLHGRFTRWRRSHIGRLPIPGTNPQGIEDCSWISHYCNRTVADACRFVAVQHRKRDGTLREVNRAVFGAGNLRQRAKNFREGP